MPMAMGQLIIKVHYWILLTSARMATLFNRLCPIMVMDDYPITTIVTVLLN